MSQFSDCFSPLSIPGLSAITTVCNSPDEVRLAARRAFRRGATQLKLMVSGGIVSFSDSLEDTQLSVEEISAAVGEARARRSYVTVHAHNAASVRNALEAGVTCFEHGSYLDEETVRAMAAKGASLVATFAVVNLMAAEAPKWGLPAGVVPRVTGVEDAMFESVQMALSYGVTVGSGADLIGPEQGRHGLQLVLRSRIDGVMRAIHAATAVNARIMGIDAEIGTLEVGKLADVIALDTDPLAHPEVFDDPAHVVAVIKGGKVLKDTTGRLALSA